MFRDMEHNARIAPAEVKIGSTVRVALDDGAMLTVTIRTPKDADPKRGIISYESPLGRAILNTREGYCVEYAVGEKTFRARVVEVME